jgi:hypothetical protein
MKRGGARLIGVATTLALYGLCSVASASDGTPEFYRTDTEKLRLIEEAGGGWSTVLRWLIEYQVVPSNSSRDSIAVHAIMAISEPGNYYHLAAHFSSIHPWQADPFLRETFLAKGALCQRWTFTRSYYESAMEPGDDVPGSTWKDVLLPIIPRWPLTLYRMPNDSSNDARVILVEALRSPDYRLLIDTEAIDGEDCLVFDYKGIQKIWIAASKGLCLMRRETRDPISLRLRTRIVTEKLGEITPGLWLPTEYNIQFLSITNEGVVERENSIRILRCVFNADVAETTFTPVHRPGSVLYEEDQSFTQVSPGGEDLLDEIVGFMVTHAGLPEQSTRANGQVWWFVGSVGAGLWAGSLLLPVAKRGRPKHQA